MDNSHLKDSRCTDNRLKDNRFKDNHLKDSRRTDNSPNKGRLVMVNSKHFMVNRLLGSRLPMSRLLPSRGCLI